MADPIVTTLANLRLLISVQADVVYESTDYDGGFWYYDSSYTGVDNTGTCIITTSGARLRRIFSGFYDVRWFGAKGDAVIDPVTGLLTAGTDDTTAFQLAMDTINAAGGGVLFLSNPNTTYGITTLGLKSGVSIFGENNTVSISALKSTASGLFYLDDSPVQRVTYKGFFLIGHIINTTQHGMYMYATGQYDPTSHTGGLWYSNFEDIGIRNFQGNQWHFEAVDDSDSYSGNDIANQFLTFKNCRGFAYKSATSRALYSKGQFGQCQFIQCQFDGAGNVNNSDSIAVELISDPGTNGTDNVYDVQFIGCTTQSTDTGFKFHYAKAVLNNQHFEGVNKAVYASATSNIIINGGSELYSTGDDQNSNWAVKSEVSNVVVSGCNLGAGNYVGDSGTIVLSDNNITAQIYTFGLTHQAGVSANTMSTGIYRHILLNSANLDLKTITSQLGNTDDLIVRAWDNGIAIADSFTRVYDDGTGNITLPANYLASTGVRTLILRNNDVAVFTRNDLGGKTWVLKSINFADRKRPAAPTVGYWMVGEKIYNTLITASTKLLGWVCTTEGYLTTNNWVANTAYALGTLVVANGNIYKVTTAGTSGTIAPSGTSTFTDGTVIWTYFPTAVFTAFGNSYTMAETDAKYALLTTTAKAATYTVNGNGTTTIKVTHGLSNITASSTVLITPRNLASAGYSYADIDATFVYIYYASAPATGTNNLKFSIEIKA